MFFRPAHRERGLLPLPAAASPSRKPPALPGNCKARTYRGLAVVVLYKELLKETREEKRGGRDPPFPPLRSPQTNRLCNKPTTASGRARRPAAPFCDGTPDHTHAHAHVHTRTQLGSRAGGAGAGAAVAVAAERPSSHVYLLRWRIFLRFRLRRRIRFLRHCVWCRGFCCCVLGWREKLVRTAMMGRGD